MASRCLSDALEVVPGNKEILNLQEEYRVARIARSGKDQVKASQHCTPPHLHM
ncbi:MAG: hypothetical protein SGPRY_004606, partial [Prymnesium sp.]